MWSTPSNAIWVGWLLLGIFLMATKRWRALWWHFRPQVAALTIIVATGFLLLDAYLERVPPVFMAPILAAWIAAGLVLGVLDRKERPGRKRGEESLGETIDHGWVLMTTMSLAMVAWWWLR